MRSGKRYKKKNNILIYILLGVFCITFIISGIQILNYINDGNENKKIVDEISSFIEEEPNTEEENTKISVDFNALKKKNLDTVGYIKVNGTNIASVVVQAKDNSFYLTHNLEKKNNRAGWIFADYRNKFDGTDKNIVIYGHNMVDGSMFAGLKNILNEEWQNNKDNRQITFITEYGTNIYEVFSVYQIEDEDYYITTGFSDDTSFEQFASRIKSRSRKNFDVDITGKDQILTLSTCADNSKYRIVLHAKKLDN